MDEQWEEHLEAAKNLAEVARRKKVEISLDLDEDIKAGETISVPLSDILLSLGSNGAKPVRVTVKAAKAAPRKAAKKGTPRKNANYGRVRAAYGGV